MDLNTVEAVVPGERAGIDRWRRGDAWLAGGTWLFSEPQPDVRRLIDLSTFDWPALTAGAKGLEIAATCTLAELACWAQSDATGADLSDSPAADDWPGKRLIPQCCRALLGSFKVWNAATVGGNLCLALPAGPMTSLVVALDGVCTIWEPGGEARTVKATEFVLGPGQAALAPGALLRSVLLPASALRCATAFRQLSLSPLGRSAALVIGRAAPFGGEFVITVTASVPRPAQLRFDAPPTAKELQQAFDTAGLEYYDDPHGDPVWREHLSRTYAEEVRCELEAGG
jgi:CO/xanthine dehydrogenase FAD-binding subunit